MNRDVQLSKEPPSISNEERLAKETRLAEHKALLVMRSEEANRPYQVIDRGTLRDLVNSVNALIGRGWKPLGGFTTDGIHYLQAMYREEGGSENA